MYYEYICGRGSSTHIIVDIVNQDEHCILDRNNNIVHLKSEYVVKRKSVVKLGDDRQRQFYVDLGYSANILEETREYLTLTDDIAGIMSLSDLNFLAMGKRCGTNRYKSSTGKLPLIKASKKPNTKSKATQAFHTRLSMEEKELLCSLLVRFVMSS